MPRGRKTYFNDDDDDKFETEAFVHMNDDDVEPDSKKDQRPETNQEVDEEETEMAQDDNSDDEAPDDVGFHESRESVLSQLRSALKQVDVEKQRKKEKRKLIDDHFKQQKLKKKEELAKAKLSDDFLGSIDDVIPKKVKKTKQESAETTVKQQKRKDRRKNKKDTTSEEEQNVDLKKEDYITFTDESSGVQVANIKMVEKQSKSAAELAAEFRNSRLYGKHVIRESNSERLAKKEKRRHRTR